MSKLVKTKIKISGMHCSACTMMIDGELEELEGVKSARTHFAKGECEIEYDEDQVSDEKLLEVISNAGYSAALITSSPQLKKPLARPHRSLEA